MKVKELVSTAITVLLALFYLLKFGDLPSAVLLVFVILLVVFSYNAARIRLRRDPGNEVKIMKRLLVFYFLIFLHLLLSFTLTSSYFYRPSSLAFTDKEQFSIYLKCRTNFIPFLTICDAISNGVFTHYTLVNVGGNILALMPMGFFLQVFFRKQRRFPVFLLTINIIVISIELLQMLFLMGSCDIDDLILNVFGALIMFFIVKIPAVRKILNKVFPGIGDELAVVN